MIRNALVIEIIHLLEPRADGCRDVESCRMGDPVLPAETVIFELAVFVLDAVQLASRALGDAPTGMPLSANWVAGSARLC